MALMTERAHRTDFLETEQEMCLGIYLAVVPDNITESYGPQSCGTAAGQQTFNMLSVSLAPR